MSETTDKIIEVLTEQARRMRWLADEQLAQHGPDEHPDSTRAGVEADTAEVMLAWALRTTKENVPSMQDCIEQAHDLIHDERTRARQRRMFPDSPIHITG